MFYILDDVSKIIIIAVRDDCLLEHTQKRMIETGAHVKKSPLQQLIEVLIRDLMQCEKSSHSFQSLFF